MMDVTAGAKAGDRAATLEGIAGRVAAELAAGVKLLSQVNALKCLLSHK